jgi:hypothetical protein
MAEGRSLMTRIVVAIIALLSTAACSTITEGTTQSLAVMTPDAPSANCTLTTPKHTWFVRTPGSVTIEKSNDDIAIVCRKEGYANGVATLPSNFEGMTWGNIIFGGIIGVGVDAASGAMHEYPTSVSIYMEESKEVASQDATEYGSSLIARGGPKSRWVGIGERDACGFGWAMDITQEVDKIKGRLWRDNVQYDLYGELDQWGAMQDALAGKSVAYNGVPGARFLKVNLQFSEQTAEGHYRVDMKSGSGCITPIELKRYASE